MNHYRCPHCQQISSNYWCRPCFFYACADCGTEYRKTLVDCPSCSITCTSCGQTWNRKYGVICKPCNYYNCSKCGEDYPKSAGGCATCEYKCGQCGQCYYKSAGGCATCDYKCSKCGHCYRKTLGRCPECYRRRQEALECRVSTSYTPGRPYNIVMDNNECDECDGFDFKSLRAGTKMVKYVDNKWTLGPEYDIMDDIGFFNTFNDIHCDNNAMIVGYNKWLNQGLAEHASIASFSRFSLDLVSLGAPSFLIELVNKGTLDEIRHSKIAFDITNLYLSKIQQNDGDDDKMLFVVNPAMLQKHNVMIDGDWKRILNDLINGGCFNELISALKSVTDSIELKSSKLLYSVAVEESKHCGLAWISALWIINNFNKEDIKDEVMMIEPMYSTRLKKIGDDEKEEKYAFNIIIPEIMKLLFPKTTITTPIKIDYYQSLYVELLSKLNSYIEKFYDMQQVINHNINYTDNTKNNSIDDKLVLCQII